MAHRYRPLPFLLWKWARTLSQSVISKMAPSAHVTIALIWHSKTLSVLAMSLSLNCLVLGDDLDEAFTVKIPKNKNISNLRDLIKEKAPYHISASGWSLLPSTIFKRN